MRGEAARSQSQNALNKPYLRTTKIYVLIYTYALINQGALINPSLRYLLFLTNILKYFKVSFLNIYKFLESFFKFVKNILEF